MIFYDDSYNDYNINYKNDYVNLIYPPTSMHNDFEQPIPNYANFGIIANTPNIPVGLEAFLITDFIDEKYD